MSLSAGRLKLNTGTDVVENARFARSISRKNGRLRERLFTAEELSSNPDDLDLAIMFSSKESVAKALGTGFDSSLSWHDIRVIVNGSNVKAFLTGRALELANGRELHLSATRTTETSFTFALLTERE